MDINQITPSNGELFLFGDSWQFITYIPYDIVGGCDLSYLGLFCFSSLVLLVGMVSYLEGKTSVVIYSRIRSDSPSLQSYPAFTCVPLYAALRAG